MKYAIIKLGGFQYTVEEGKEYSVPRFDAEEGKDFDQAEVLAVASDATTIEFGKPVLTKAKVTLNIIAQAKGEKVVKRVYKAKSRVKKTTGHRKLVTRFKVAKITL